jgi:phage-related protein
MYEVLVYDPDELAALPEDVRTEAHEELEILANTRSPDTHRGTERLGSAQQLYKLRLRRNHRLLFGVVGRYLVVLRIAHRSDGRLYRDLGHLEELYEQAATEIQPPASA